MSYETNPNSETGTEPYKGERKLPSGIVIDKDGVPWPSTGQQIISRNFGKLLGYPPCMLYDPGPSSMERMFIRLTENEKQREKYAGRIIYLLKQRIRMMQ